MKHYILQHNTSLNSKEVISYADVGNQIEKEMMTAYSSNYLVKWEFRNKLYGTID